LRFRAAHGWWGVFFVQDIRRPLVQLDDPRIHRLERRLQVRCGVIRMRLDIECEQEQTEEGTQAHDL
jgi:hypothetical protein